MFNTFVLLLVVSLLGSVTCFDYAQNQTIIEGKYYIMWSVDLVAGNIRLAYSARTVGWVGFGISELTSGSMPGSDIVVGTVVNGAGSVTDYYSTAFAKPSVDVHQDWVLVGSDETDGWTTIEVTRSLATSDPQDRAIISGPNRIIAAFGASDSFGYHSTNRTTGEVTFFGAPVFDTTPDPEERTLDLRVSNYFVPNSKTVYACQSFAMPVDGDFWITRIDPLVDAGNVAHVHHFLAHVCQNTSTGTNTPIVQTYNNNPNQCVTPLGQVSKGCTGILAAWAAGGGSIHTPPEAAFRMGSDPQAIKHVVLEIHYNNPTQVNGTYQGGYTDTSGVRIHYTTKARQYEADVMTLGDPFVQFPAIPTGTVTEYESECLSNCTQSFTSPLNVFQSFPHMHQVGSSIWTTQWRNGQKVDEFGRIEFWAFDHQQTQSVNLTIQPGDRLNTHCVYNTTGVAGSNVTFGLASDQEMCMHFLSYYPKLYTTARNPYSFCGFRRGGSVCGDATASGRVAVLNPANRDPPGGAARRFGFIAPTPAPTVPTPDPTPLPTPDPTPLPTPDPTPLPTPDPTPLPTPNPTPLPTPDPTPLPTPDPTPQPTPLPTPAPDVCTPSLGITLSRVSGWNDGTRYHSQWAIKLITTTRPLYSVVLSIVPDQGTVESYWPLIRQFDGSYVLNDWRLRSNFPIPPGEQFLMGVIIGSSSAPAVSVVNSSCVQPSWLDCHLSAFISVNSAWNDGVYAYKQYGISFTNQGSHPTASVDVTISLPAQTVYPIVSSYNLATTDSSQQIASSGVVHYNAPLWGLYPGSSSGASGFTIKLPLAQQNAPAPTLAFTKFNCL